MDPLSDSCRPGSTARHTQAGVLFSQRGSAQLIHLLLHFVPVTHNFLSEPLIRPHFLSPLINRENYSAVFSVY